MLSAHLCLQQFGIFAKSPQVELFARGIERKTRNTREHTCCNITRTLDNASHYLL